MVRDFIVTIRQWLTSGDSGPILVAIVLVAVLLSVILVVVFVLYARTPKGRVSALLDDRAEGEDWSRWAVRLVPLVVIVLAVVLFETQADNPAQCLKCHTQAAWGTAVEQGPHAGGDCLDCHGATGPLSLVTDIVTYARWTVVYTLEKTESTSTPGFVQPDACLRCHGAIVRGTVESRGIKVRHSDFLETGSRCSDCHNAIAHGDLVAQPTVPTMSACIVCHDGEEASQECAYCHAADPLELASLDARVPRSLAMGTGDCYVCHDEAPCLACHGVRMPHPEGWSDEAGRAGESGEFHARQGFENREVCWRCHFSNDRPFERPESRGHFRETPDGCTCHGSFGTMHGGAAWVEEHGLQATGEKTGQFSDCYTCHDARYFCAMCHDASMQERYDPRGGPDAYRRDIPLPPGYWEY